MNTDSIKHKISNLAFMFGAGYLLVACTTVTVHRDNRAVSAIEMDEFTEPLFYRDGASGEEQIGTLYVSGKNVYINGARIEETMAFNNNAFVKTGAASAVRIEFDQGNGACHVHVEEFTVGQSYGNTANCRHTVETAHAASQMENSAYHFTVNAQQTILTVLQGVVSLALRSSPMQKIFVQSGQEAILTADKIVGPLPVPLQEIQRRIRWRQRYQFVDRQIDWATVAKVAAGLAVVGGVAAAVATDDDSGPDNPPPPQRGATPDRSPEPSGTGTRDFPQVPLEGRNIPGVNQKPVTAPVYVPTYPPVR